MHNISKYRKLNYEEFTQNIGLYTCVSYSLSMQIKKHTIPQSNIFKKSVYFAQSSEKQSPKCTFKIINIPTKPIILDK